MSEPMGSVLNHSGSLAQPLEQHSCLNSSDLHHEPLSKVAMESSLLLNKINLLLNKNDGKQLALLAKNPPGNTLLLLNKNDGKQLALLAKIHQPTQWKEVLPCQSLWGQCSTAVDYFCNPWSSTLSLIVQESVTNLCPKEQWKLPFS